MSAISLFIRVAFSERHPIIIIGCGEVEVGREAPCISRSEFS